MPACLTNKGGVKMFRPFETKNPSRGGEGFVLTTHRNNVLVTKVTFQRIAETCFLQSLNGTFFNLPDALFG